MQTFVATLDYRTRARLVTFSASEFHKTFLNERLSPHRRVKRKLRSKDASADPGCESSGGAKVPRSRCTVTLAEFLRQNGALRKDVHHHPMIISDDQI